MIHTEYFPIKYNEMVKVRVNLYSLYKLCQHMVYDEYELIDIMKDTDDLLKKSEIIDEYLKYYFGTDKVVSFLNYDYYPQLPFGMMQKIYNRVHLNSVLNYEFTLYIVQIFKDNKELNKYKIEDLNRYSDVFLKHFNCNKIRPVLYDS